MTKMVNQRIADYPVADIFLERWSPRSFKEQEIPEDLLMSVFEAARWAPSARNRQPWYFILATTKEEREVFHQFIFEGNLQWAKKAPVLALLLSRKTAEDGEENRYHTFDAGCAWGYLALQATKNGLITRAIGGFDKEKARELLDIPSEYECHLVIPIGYPGEKEGLPEELQEKERPTERRPIKESIFKGKFGRPL